MGISCLQIQLIHHVPHTLQPISLSELSPSPVPTPWPLLSQHSDLYFPPLPPVCCTMYLPSTMEVPAPQTELRHTAATISYAGQLLLGSNQAYTAEHKQSVDLQSVYDLQMEQRWSVRDHSRFVSPPARL